MASFAEGRPPPTQDIDAASGSDPGNALVFCPTGRKKAGISGRDHVKPRGTRTLRTRTLRTRTLRTRTLAFVVAAAIGLLYAAAPAMAQEKLTVWWVKGFYKSEDDALNEAIRKFGAKTGTKVELSQYAIQDMIPKTVAALDSGTPPDVAYADSYDVQAAGKWGFEGKLEDLTDILSPMKAAFAPNTLETAALYNDQTRKKAYYGFPLKQQTMHVNIWKDMLEQAGFKESEIPAKRAGYWSFWCDKVQPAIRKE